MVNNRDYLCTEVSLLDLNDDCLELIMRNLNMLQQFQLSKIHIRFKNIVEIEWRRRWADNVAINGGHFQDTDDVEFVDFMKALEPYVKRLIVRNLDMRRWRLLTDCVFRQMVAIDLCPASRDVKKFERCEDQFVNEDLLMLQRVFPQLQILKLRACQITGKYLSKFRSLQQLSLDECQCLESEHFRDVFFNLKLRKFDIMEDCDELNCCDLIEIKKCPSLEHVKIADYHLCFDTDIINDILGMPHLRKLSIYSKNFVFDVIERISLNRIKTIKAFKFNGVLHNFERFFREITHMKSLRKLSFYDCCGEDMVGIRSHLLLELAKQLPELSEVQFCACELENDNGVLQFVRYCPNLCLINLTRTTRINKTFLWKCIELLRNQKWRVNMPLELWVKDTNIGSDILNDHRINKYRHLLRIDTKKSTLNTDPPGVLKFTFTS